MKFHDVIVFKCTLLSYYRSVAPCKSRVDRGYDLLKDEIVDTLVLWLQRETRVIMMSKAIDMIEREPLQLEVGGVCGYEFRG